MFVKRTDEEGQVYYENDQCRAYPIGNVVYLPYFLGYNKGVYPPKGGGLHAKDMLNWLVRETRINRFVVTDVLAPEEYVKRLRGEIVGTGRDQQVVFEWV